MPIQKMTPQEMLLRMQSGDAPVLLDVREAEEYERGTVRTAQNAPLSALAECAAALVPDRQTPIAVICQSGRRSAMAAAQLSAMGYAHIYDLGGVMDWPQPLVRP